MFKSHVSVARRPPPPQPTKHKPRKHLAHGTDHCITQQAEKEGLELGSCLWQENAAEAAEWQHQRHQQL